MTEKQPPSYPLRMPQELREQLTEAAKKSGRSMNAEIVTRLEGTLQGYIDKDLTFKMLSTEVDRLTEELRAVRGSGNQLMAKIAPNVEQLIRRTMDDTGLTFEETLLLTVTRGAAMETSMPVVIVQVEKGTPLHEARALMQVINEYAPNDSSVFYEQVDVPKTRLLTSEADKVELAKQKQRETPSR